MCSRIRSSSSSSYVNGWRWGNWFADCNDKGFISRFFDIVAVCYSYVFSAEILMLGRDDVEIEIRVRGFRWWRQGAWPSGEQGTMGLWVASCLIYGANELSIVRATKYSSQCYHQVLDDWMREEQKIRDLLLVTLCRWELIRLEFEVRTWGHSDYIYQRKRCEQMNRWTDERKNGRTLIALNLC